MRVRDTTCSRICQEAKRRGLSLVVEHHKLLSPSSKSAKVTSAALTAAQKEAERLRQELAALKAQQEQQQQTISSDKQKPVINIAGTAMNGPRGTIKGYVGDNTGIAEVREDGEAGRGGESWGISIGQLPTHAQSGLNVSIEAVDLAGLTSSTSASG